MRIRIVTGLVLISLLGSACGGASKAGTSTPAPSTSASPAATVYQVTDPKGDTGLPESLGYLDILSAGARQGSKNSLSFVFTLSKPIPSTFEVPSPYNAVGWEFCLSNASTEPSGYPFAASTATPCEFIVMDTSQGGEVTGSLIDRRPLLHGKEAVTTSVPVTINGTEVATSVPGASIGLHPHGGSGIQWVLFATELTLPLGNDDFTNTDEAPDGNFDNPACLPCF